MALEPIGDIADVSLSAGAAASDPELAQLLERRKKTYRFGDFVDQASLAEQNAQLHERRQKTKSQRDTL